MVILCAMPSGGSWPCLLRSGFFGFRRSPAAPTWAMFCDSSGPLPVGICQTSGGAPAPVGSCCPGCDSSDRFPLIPCDDSGGRSGETSGRCQPFGRAPGFVRNWCDLSRGPRFRPLPWFSFSFGAPWSVLDPEGEPTISRATYGGDSMPKAEDLTGRQFGRLRVVSRAENVLRGSQKKVAWSCSCSCGSERPIIVTSQDLKTGKVKSCGCLRSEVIHQSNKEIRKCVVCGKDFSAFPSQNNVTCGKDCQKEYARIRATGKKKTADTRQKISERSRGRDMTELQPKATKAAKESPNSGAFETNVNAIDWELISPDGKVYRFHSLANWLREHGEEHFGVRPGTKEFLNVRAGLTNVKLRWFGGKYPSATYKGWSVVPTDSDFRNRKVPLL